MQPDTLLCALAERGNEDAFGILHTRYRQQVFAFVYHLLGRPGSVDDAEDLTQEIMQKAYAHLNTRRSGGSFKAWLFRIARNHTFDHIRARKPSSVSLDDTEQGVEPSNVVSLHSQVEHRADLAWLLGALGALPERQRQALVMREMGGQSVDEIAECLDTTPESAKQLIKRGRASVTTAAEAGGVRSRKLGRDLAAAAPITAIAWLGAGKASAAGVTGGAVAGAGAAGGAAAAGTTAGGVAAGAGGLAVVSGKVAATVLAVAAIGAGGVVVGEEAISGGEPAAQQTGADGSGPAVPAQSLVVGDKAAEQAVANKKLANERRERARERATAKKKAKARARAKAKAERAKRAKANGGKSSTRGNKGGNSGSNSNSNSTGGGKSSGGSGNSQSTTSPSQGSGNSSSGSDGGGSANGGGSNSSGGGNGKGKPTE